MPHPLSDLDGKRKYVFSAKGEDFYLRVVASEAEMRKSEGAARALSAVMHDSKIEKQKELSNRGEELRDRSYLTVNQDGINDFIDRALPESFGKTQSQVVFVLENAAREFATAMLMTINDPVKRQDLQIEESVGTFVYVSDLTTADKYKGRSFLSTSFDKVLTMLSNPKRGFAQPFEYSVSMTAVTATKSDRSTTDYVMNLPLYARMWQARFIDNELQDRWIKGGKQTGHDRRSLECAMTGGVIDEAKVNALIQNQKTAAAQEGKEVRGLYLSGVGADYEQVAQGRKDRLVQRGSQDMTRDKSEKLDGKSFQVHQLAMQPQLLSMMIVWLPSKMMGFVSLQDHQLPGHH